MVMSAIVGIQIKVVYVAAANEIITLNPPKTLHKNKKNSGGSVVVS